MGSEMCIRDRSFGAVVDLFIPIESKILVEVGQHVDSGSTVLAELIHSEPLSSVKDHSE